jgi:hypothetical protein
LELLAGIVDSDGWKKDNQFYITTIYEHFAYEIKELADSLGYRTNVEKYTQFVKCIGRDYENYLVTIGGLLDEVPVLIPRKKVIFNHKGSCYYKPQSFDGYDISVISGLKIEDAGIGEYFGFEIDGDNRFLLADNTVVHNSKSHTLSFASIIWDMYRYERQTELIIPPKDIVLCKESMLITNEFKLAKKLLKKIKSEVEGNEILNEKLYPGRFAEGWSKESLTCKNGAELTLSSFHSSNRGPHPGRITVDDFLDRSALYSKEARERFREAFMAEVTNMLVPNGRLRVIGTPFSTEDLYHDLKKESSWAVFEYPALFPDGSVLWPDRYDFEALMEKRKLFGNLIFSREFLVRPISDSVSIFPYSILENAFIGMEKFRLVQNRQSYPTKFKKVCIGCDFALSGSANADYSVFSVVGIDANEHIHLIHVTRLRGASHNEQIARIQGLNSNFSPNVIVFETNGFQKVMFQLAKQAGMRNVMEFNTTGFKKKDAYEGIPSLAVMFERAEIKFPRGDEYSIETTNMVAGELNSMVFDEDTGKLEAASGKDDCVLSLFFAIRGLKQVNTGFRISMLDTSAMLYD